MEYTETTENIKITVVSEHVRESSLPEDGVYAFSYSIQIENLNEEPVQLLERHWVVISGQKRTAEIAGPGLLGDQPVLDSGEVYSFDSAAVIQDPVGAMEGFYIFKTGEGQYVQAHVPRCDLLYPVIMH